MSEALPGYEAARRRAASIELEDRGVLAVTGPLRQKFLHNLLSNDVQSLKAGEGRLAALMDVKGHLQALMRVLVAEDTVLLELPKARLASLEATFVHYRVGTPVRFAARPTRVFAVLGPESQALLASLGLEAPAGNDSHALRHLGEHEVRVVRASDLPGPGFVLHAEPEAVPALVEALRAAGAAELGADSLDALRIESGRPWYGPDVTSDNLLHETGLLSQYHSSSKGCYIGQEVVARLEGRGGNVSRKLRGIRLSAPAAAGVALSAEGREVGRITSYALSPRLGPIALAYVHRAHSEPGTAVEVSGAAAAVVALPFADPTTEGVPQP